MVASRQSAKTQRRKTNLAVIALRVSAVFDSRPFAKFALWLLNNRDGCRENFYTFCLPVKTSRRRFQAISPWYLATAWEREWTWSFL